VKYLLTLLFCASAFGADVGEINGRKDGQKGWWILPGFFSAGKAKDISAFSNDGVPVNSPVISVYNGRPAIKFNGTSSYVSIPHASQISSTSNFSVFAWVNTPTLSKRCLGKLTAGRTGWYLEIYAGGFYFNYYKSSSIFGSVQANAPTTATGVWQHVGFYYPGDGSYPVCYFNGARVSNLSTYSFGGGARDGIVDGGGAFNIGATWQGAAAFDYFPGAVDNVRYYARKPSDAEVAALYKEELR
jgi:hypothetical protein